MKKINQILLLASVATVLFLGAGHAVAQGRGNFDPAQIKERMMTHYREQMDVKDDAEWKLLETQIGKVMDARREVGFGSFGGFSAMGFGGRSRSGGDTNNAATNQGSSRRRAFGGEPSPEADALQKAIDAKAPASEIKSKLKSLREATKAKEAKLEKAQSDLRKLLTARQEAVAVLGGLLK